MMTSVNSQDALNDLVLCWDWTTRVRTHERSKSSLVALGFYVIISSPLTLDMCRIAVSVRLTLEIAVQPYILRSATQEFTGHIPMVVFTILKGSRINWEIPQRSLSDGRLKIKFVGDEFNARVITFYKRVLDNSNTFFIVKM